MRKKIFLWILMISLLFAYVPVTASDTSVITVKTEKAYIKVLQEAMLKRKPSVTIKYTGKTLSDPFGMVDLAMFSDNKKTSDDGDYFRSCVISRSGSHSTYSTYYFTYAETAKQTKAVNKKVKKVVAALKLSGKTDAEKVRAIHDYVANLVSYDYSINPISMEGGDHSAYGGLVSKKHKTLCSGYAGIVYKMLTEAGVACHIISGWTGSEPHVWNIVKLGKKWYHLDVTWDDTVAKGISYDYYLVGNDSIEQDHDIDDVFLKKYKISKTDYWGR